MYICFKTVILIVQISFQFKENKLSKKSKDLVAKYDGANVPINRVRHWFPIGVFMYYLNASK